MLEEHCFPALGFELYGTTQSSFKMASCAFTCSALSANIPTTPSAHGLFLFIWQIEMLLLAVQGELDSRLLHSQGAGLSGLLALITLSSTHRSAPTFHRRLWTPGGHTLGLIYFLPQVSSDEKVLYRCLRHKWMVVYNVRVIRFVIEFTKGFQTPVFIYISLISGQKAWRAES